MVVLLSKTIAKAYKPLYYLGIYAKFYLGEMKRLNICRHTECHSINTISSRVAIFVAYHPKSTKEMPSNNKKICSALHAGGYYVLYVHNGFLDRQFTDTASQHVDYIIERENIGHDFGGYKAGFCFLQSLDKSTRTKISRVLFVNDSCVCISSSRLKNFILEMEQKQDNTGANVIGPFVNTAVNAHVQSNLFVIDRATFNCKEYIRFWQNYIPVSGKRYAIHKGEVGHTNHITQAGLQFSAHISSIFVDDIHEDFTALQMLLPKGPSIGYLGLKHEFAELYNRFMVHLPSISSGDINNYIKGFITDAISLYEGTNHSHTFGLLAIVFKGYPMIKKDVYFRGSFTKIQTQLALSMIQSYEVDSDAIANVESEILSRPCIELERGLIKKILVREALI